MHMHMQYADTISRIWMIAWGASCTGDARPRGAATAAQMVSATHPGPRYHAVPTGVRVDGRCPHGRHPLPRLHCKFVACAVRLRAALSQRAPASQAWRVRAGGAPGWPARSARSRFPRCAPRRVGRGGGREAAGGAGTQGGSRGLRTIKRVAAELEAEEGVEVRRLLGK